MVWPKLHSVIQFQTQPKSAPNANTASLRGQTVHWIGAHVKVLSERSKESKEQNKNKGGGVLVAESAYNAQNAQFGLVMIFFPKNLLMLFPCVPADRHPYYRRCLVLCESSSEKCERMLSKRSDIQKQVDSAFGWTCLEECQHR